jgi:hypothetical protein
MRCSQTKQTVLILSGKTTAKAKKKKPNEGVAKPAKPSTQNYCLPAERKGRMFLSQKLIIENFETRNITLN